MSEQSTDEQGLTGLSRRVTDWLRSFGQPRAPAPPQIERLDPQRAAEMLQRAAQCYARAGWADDAVRLFVQLGDDRQAAPYYERQGQWEAAATCYTRFGDWSNAARCYLAGKRPAEAAECALKAGQPLQAAWLWADLVHHVYRAEATLDAFAAATDPDRLAVALIRARCEASRGATLAAGRRLNRALTQLRRLPPDGQRHRLYAWAQHVAAALHRPDLSILIHTAAVAAGLPDAQAAWEDWAANTLGDVIGVPEALIAKPPK